METKSFLPQNYRKPSKSEQFLKLKNGQNTFRILSPQIVEGFVCFGSDNKPRRKKIVRDENGDFDKSCEFSTDELLEIGCKKKKKSDGSEGTSFDVKYFWLVLVWDWETQSFKALEITQSSIINSILSILKTESPKKKGEYPYANPADYDLIINKSGEGINTEYEVLRMDKEPLPQEILDTFESLEYNLDAVFNNEYPFD